MANSRLHHERASLRLIKDKLECGKCDSQHLCLDSCRDEETMHALNSVTISKGPYKIGDFIYKMENQFKSLFIIQTGVIKLEKPLRDGNIYVTGFYFPGDIIGLESAGGAKYNYDAVVLDQAWVCEMPYHYFESQDPSSVLLKEHIISLYGQKLREADRLLAHDRYQTGEQRLLQFLEMLCKKLFTQNLEKTHKLQLPMSKGDIANYLGLRPESISRALQKLQRQGVIRNYKNAIEIVDMNVAKKMICRS